MTLEQAKEKTIDWHNLHNEADCEEENGCFGSAERLRNEALDIQKELESAGYDVYQLIRTIQTQAGL